MNTDPQMTIARLSKLKSNVENKIMALIVDFENSSHMSVVTARYQVIDTPAISVSEHGAKIISIEHIRHITLDVQL